MKIYKDSSWQWPLVLGVGVAFDCGCGHWNWCHQAASCSVGIPFSHRKGSSRFPESFYCIWISGSYKLVLLAITVGKHAVPLMLLPWPVTHLVIVLFAL
jgi:hypothetical protein